MPVAALTTLGCKVNQWETERIAEDFARAGFVLTSFDSPADVYVINSCSVTESADKKSRYLARKASRTNPDAVVVMTGCHSQQVLDHDGWVDGATLLVPNDEKLAVFDRVSGVSPRRSELFVVAGDRAVASGACQKKAADAQGAGRLHALLRLLPDSHTPEKRRSRVRGKRSWRKPSVWRAKERKNWS